MHKRMTSSDQVQEVYSTKGFNGDVKNERDRLGLRLQMYDGSAWIEDEKENNPLFAISVHSRDGQCFGSHNVDWAQSNVSRKTPRPLRLKNCNRLSKDDIPVTRNDILLAAACLPRKRATVVDSSDTDSDYNYLLGPRCKKSKKGKFKDFSYQRRMLENPKCGVVRNSSKFSKFNDFVDSLQLEEPRHGSLLQLPQPPDTASTSPNSRRMITVTRAASKMQKLLPGYPGPADPFPEDFALTELCRKYPNHLFGVNLHPFLQYGWSPGRIVSLLPSQEDVVNIETITVNAIASRLRKVRAALEKSGGLEDLMNAEKTHHEGEIISQGQACDEQARQTRYQEETEASNTMETYKNLFGRFTYQHEHAIT